MTHSFHKDLKGNMSWDWITQSTIIPDQTKSLSEASEIDSSLYVQFCLTLSFYPLWINLKGRIIYKEWAAISLHLGKSWKEVPSCSFWKLWIQAVFAGFLPFWISAVLEALTRKPRRVLPPPAWRKDSVGGLGVGARGVFLSCQLLLCALGKLLSLNFSFALDCFED